MNNNLNINQNYLENNNGPPNGNFGQNNNLNSNNNFTVQPPPGPMQVDSSIRYQNPINNYYRQSNNYNGKNYNNFSQRNKFKRYLAQKTKQIPLKIEATGTVSPAAQKGMRINKLRLFF